MAGFLENLFAPFGDFYKEYQATLPKESQESKSYDDLVEHDEWFKLDHIDKEDMQDFVDWWFDYGQFDDQWDWEDFRELYEEV